MKLSASVRSCLPGKAFDTFFFYYNYFYNPKAFYRTCLSLQHTSLNKCSVIRIMLIQVVWFWALGFAIPHSTSFVGYVSYSIRVLTALFNANSSSCLKNHCLPSHTWLPKWSWCLVLVVKLFWPYYHEPMMVLHVDTSTRKAGDDKRQSLLFLIFCTLT